MVELTEFVDDMAEAFNWADLIICRAGASTVSEVAVSGACAVFVPYPYAVDDHQTANAQWLVKQDAALCFAENELQTDTMIDQIKQLISSSENMNKMRQRAKNVAYLNAASDVADYCEQISTNSLRKKVA